MSVRKILLTTVAGLFLGGGALAYTYGFERNELSESFCPDLANQQVYEQKKMEHYSILIPGKDGWVFRTENDFRKDWEINDKTLNYLLTLQNAFRMHNAELVMLMPPVRGLAHYDKLFRKDKKKYGLKNASEAWDKYEAGITDLQNKGIRIIGLGRNEVTPDFFYKRDHHWTASGANVAATKIAEFIKSIPLYSQIEKIDYATTEETPIEYESTFEKAFKKICNTNLPKETVPQYITASANPVQSSDDLFGENQGSEPQIVLLGTSNSVNASSQANFEGFLKDYLSTDIMNLSYIGAGIDTGIMTYVNSDHFRNGKPKVVIWEVPGYYDLNVMDDKLFNQVIPAAIGACSAPVYEKSLASLPGGSTTLFEDEAKSSLQPASFPAPEQVAIGQDMYMRLTFSKPVRDKFKVDFLYENSGTKSQNFERSERAAADGEFYTLFPVNDSKIKKISVIMPKDARPVDLSVQICRLPQQDKPLSD